MKRSLTKMALIAGAVLMALLVSAGPVLAGIRIVLNGGGLGEMLARSQASFLADWLHAVYRAPEVFQLRADEKAVLERLLGRISDAPEGIELAFIEEMEGFVPFEVRPFLIELWAANLYSSDGRALALDEISAQVFEGLLRTPGVLGAFSPSEIETARALGLRVLDQARVETQDIVLGRREELFQLWTLRFGGETHFVFTIRKGPQSWDMTAAVRAALECANGATRILRVSNLHLDGRHIAFQARWSCGERAYDSRVIARLPLTLEEGTISALSFQRMSLTPVPIHECQGKLGGSER